VSQTRLIRVAGVQMEPAFGDVAQNRLAIVAPGERDS
jgi:hypothetical protein